jgi:hypothetical protein
VISLSHCFVSASVEISQRKEQVLGRGTWRQECYGGKYTKGPSVFYHSRTHAHTYSLTLSSHQIHMHACMHVSYTDICMYAPPTNSTATNLQLRQRRGTQQQGRREHTRERYTRPALNLSIDFRFPITPFNGAQDGGMSVSRYV